MCLALNGALTRFHIDQRAFSRTAPAPLATEFTKLITEATIMGDFQAAVNLCFRANRPADALVLAHCGGPTLFRQAQVRNDAPPGELGLQTRGA